ncbi:LPXTG-motif cell wall anchor domain-containing protein [Pseudobutyrivibrio sp. JW11]|uniref:SpaA isopeptide-forming pilin-related protein n=1 Tax=Pseudobutyrivibrio sp. JW11 TaxID=1855302 RepID=UPI0008F26EB8|nr:LPXTG cell wall anchor domain-containing protein [Pseudobutyrivibrio sp. JW11]SFO16636.1 LPXTG-motif cell wall anchor domain-containing protein [Pseudobutyrivibrio sp. JW11]
MKKIRKIVALALATVMMMAMSITAFAEEATASVTITNFPESSEGATVNAYQIASVKDNEIEVVDWAKSAGFDKVATKDDTQEIEMTPEVAKKLAETFNQETAGKPVTTKVTKGVATFTNLAAGAYFFTVAGNDDLDYNAMVAVTVKRDENGNYVVKNAELKAKSEPKKVQKSEDDKYVTTKEDHVVTYTVSTTVPFVKPKETIEKKFAICDKLVGGKYAVKDNGKLEVKINVGGTDLDPREVEIVDNGFELNLNDLVVENAHANEKVVLTYGAIATDVKMYNTAYSITPKHQSDDQFETTSVYAYTGKLIVEKVGENEEPLENAEFIIIKMDGDKELYAVLDKNNNNKFLSWTSNKEEATPIVTKFNADKTAATASAFGFDVADNGEANTYYFEEVKAPNEWTINTEKKEAKFVIESSNYNSQQSADEEYVVTVKYQDSKLAQLPFTGGMGTTIFTVLGVAIMAMASALYFATKKKATK